MAMVMVDRQASMGACLESDLTCIGFTRDEIAEHAEAARVMARTVTATIDLDEARSSRRTGRRASV